MSTSPVAVWSEDSGHGDTTPQSVSLGSPQVSRNATSYLGYTHFGVDTLGADLLPIMGDPVHAPGSQGFTAPLASGVYTFLAQQLGEDSLYQFDFEVTPVPAPSGLLVAGLSALAISCRRCRRTPVHQPYLT